MIVTSHSQVKPSQKLLKFLGQKIGLTDNAINLGIRQSEIEQSPLPIILWSFGLITLEQFQMTLDWEKSQS